MKDYKRITVQDIIDYIKSEPEKFPDGMKTVIVSGDFEGNYTHEKHEIQDMVGWTHNKKKFPNAICLGYEMHEGESGVWDIQTDEHTKTYLRRNGYQIFDCSKQYNKVRPYLILWDRRNEEIVYVDLLVHKPSPKYRPQRWYRNWMHRRKVKCVFNKWLRVNKWRGKHRFDVVEVYPPFQPSRGDVRPVIDHIIDVKM